MRNALLVVVFVVLTILAIPVVLVSAVFGRGNIFLGYGTWMMGVGRRILGIDLAVEGLDRLDRKTPYVFMSNHLSFLDAPLLVQVLDRPVRFIVKRFVLRIPVLGWGMKAAGYVPLDKEGMGEGRKRIARASRMIAEHGHSFLIYPEGTRSADGTLQRFRRGGFFLALDSGAPIVPVSIRGTYELMPRRTWRVRRGPVRIVFHEPIPVSGRTPEAIPGLMERVRSIIAADLA
jgi:1-acyl-sn-glycerol-3-phosphate acyltransferase